ncbi:DNA-binding transcriptional LysR family regulator [Rhodopseudomonas julia]|uniref:DNA-binding transcriptional LysR family regulator n=1 Tax=Rhodopseudomonas julia TaxID=200617 RepID=A0ABU0C8E1_9BRAD|nr:LysR substrate-binding domain-containing protein [Rhodopseudomonas julia]MDQ0326453.1 DNA-binding transcriptional LysR family regulator [Rhodopseudomonas julia]
MIKGPSLDLDCVRAFAVVADAKSFTAAGKALGATQSTISMRIRKLEERLGKRLLERNPRSVALTRAGADFLEDARRVLEVHDEAAQRALGQSTKTSFVLAISDHAAGGLLPPILAAFRRDMPDIRLAVHVGSSNILFRAFEEGRFDAVIGRSGDLGSEGRHLMDDRLVWLAAADFVWAAPEPLPLLALASPCEIRDIAVSALASAGVPWRTAFLGTGVGAIQAAAEAGLGVACLEARNVPSHCRVLAAEDGLPALPPTRIVLRMRDESTQAKAIADALVAAFANVLERPRLS